MAEDLSFIGEGTDLEPIEEVAEDVEPATPERLQEITTQAALQYSLKHFSQAAELYSTACQLQDELHGEMAPENAELFYLYGRALYKVAVQNSDVLGGQVAAEKKKTKSNGKAKKNAVEEKPASTVSEATAVEEKKAAPAAGTPYFQITGMENWDSDEEDAEDEEGEGEDEEDDFATAYEILDVSRVLYERQMEASTNGDTAVEDKGKAKVTGAAPKLKEMLSDVYDLQAEISLENERFADAIPDFRSSLALKLEFLPKESSIIAEAHFKLSLALEFASVTALREAQAADGENAKVKKEDVDEEMRAEAAKQMELAIESCRLRLSKEEEAMASMSGEEKVKQEKSVAEVKEIVGDMEQRLTDLRAPAVSATGGSGGAADALSAASGIFAQALGETAEEQKKRIMEATKNANDLSGLVKRKKPKVEDSAPAASAVNGSSKRKMEDDAAIESDSKKTKI